MQSESQQQNEESRVKLSDVIGAAFFDVHRAIKRETHSEFWLKGGRGSLKSSFAAIEIIHGMMEDEQANAIVFRKVSDTIRTSVLETLLWAIGILDVDHLWSHTVSPAVLTYLPTGQKIIFRGLDMPTKIKSIKLKRGYFKFSWFEELEEFSGMTEIRSVLQSVTRGGAAYIHFFTYNPPNDPQTWVNAEAAVYKESRYVHHSTYHEAPPEWLGEAFIKEAEWLRENNNLAYQHEYMGLAVGIHEAIIFAGKIKVRDFEPEPHWHGAYYGLDWGFSQDPLVLIRCWIEDVGDRSRLYVDYEAYGINISIDDTPEFLEQVPDCKKNLIRADSARPEMINHMQLRGFNVIGAEKWAGSVEDGIAVLKNFTEIVIHTRCRQFQEEGRLYSYKIDKLTKQVRPDIVDKYNHGWDALRYALQVIIKERKMGYTQKQIKEATREVKTTDAPRMGEMPW